MATPAQIGQRREALRLRNRKNLRQWRARAAAAGHERLCGFCHRRRSKQIVVRINPKTWKPERKPYCGEC